MLVQAAKEGILAKEEALAAVESLAKTGSRLSKVVVRKTVELIRES